MIEMKAAKMSGRVFSFFASLTLIATTVRCATIRVKGGCPEGHKPGDTWEREGCQQCFCDVGWWTCSSCGVCRHEYDKNSCYLERSKSGYPECCKHKRVCKGQDGFDESKLQPDPNQRRKEPEITGVVLTENPVIKAEFHNLIAHVPVDVENTYVVPEDHPSDWDVDQGVLVKEPILLPEEPIILGTEFVANVDDESVET
ncbi:unnamed protein product [Lymnaea stagnalis]|uniref:Uncharacterized protein n=1 Tax=Lymnaea stagnalis TaxID=6523 RepID=A0AAV2I3R8_LYMST